MYLQNKEGYDYVVLDIEANSLHPDLIWCVVSSRLGSGEYTRHVGHVAIKLWADGIDRDRTIFVGHNAISYDLPALNRVLDCRFSLDQVVDTQVLSFLYHPKLNGGHSLEAYGERFGMPKVGADIADWTRYQPVMLERCKRDVELTERLLSELRSRMNVIGFSELSCQIEHSIRQAVDWQEENGFDFDAEKAAAFLHEMEKKEEGLRAEVQKQFPPELRVEKTIQYRIRADGTEGHHVQLARQTYPKVEITPDGMMECHKWYDFNLGSYHQRLRRLEEWGYVAVNKTKGGNPQVDEDGLNAFLEECSHEVQPAVRALAEWLCVNSRIKMVSGWLEAVHPDGAIHGTVWTCGAGSRRCTHTNPNTANIPTGEAPYGEECRSFWRARTGRVLVGLDAKSIQMRMFAHRLGNLEVGMEYAEGDPHSRNAEAAAIPRKKVKNCFYAMIFGCQDPRLGRTGHGNAGTAQQGAAIRQALYATTPGLEALFKKANRAYQDGNGWLELMDGGWVRCPSPHAALNYWVQGDEAVLMKMVVVSVWREIVRLGLDALQVGFIHDEVQYDCLDRETAEKVTAIFKRAIRRCGEYLKFIIPMEGSEKYGTTWAETH